MIHSRWKFEAVLSENVPVCRWEPAVWSEKHLTLNYVVETVSDSRVHCHERESETAHDQDDRSDRCSDYHLGPYASPSWSQNVEAEMQASRSTRQALTAPVERGSMVEK